RPRHWTGCRVAPRSVEFWQDGMHRLHDRFRFTRAEAPGPAGPWTVERLWP
ncbi:MAG: pyridoxamine 5'-phosphate oxidase, partial [Elusimicrobia bacterium]